MLIIDEIKTVDELVEYYLDGSDDVFDINDSINYILSESNNRLLSILKSDTNRSSKYDLTIINIAKSIIIQLKPKFSTYQEDLTSILEVYKNRKE